MGWYATRLEVIDVSDPERPALVGSTGLDYGGRSYAANYVTRHGDTVALAGDTTVVLVDVGDPATPTVVAAHDVGERVFATEAVGPYLCLLTAAGLLVLDATNVAALPVVGRLAFDVTDAAGRDLSAGVFGSRPLVSIVGGGRLTLVDLADPTRPHVVAERAQPSRWRFVASVVEGQYVHLVTERGGYLVLRVEALADLLAHRAWLPFAGTGGGGRRGGG